MTNSPKQKGTSFENEVAAALSVVWPDIHRSATNTPSQDLEGTPGWVVECKHQKRWQLFKWITRVRARAETVRVVGPNVTRDADWVIVAAHGDRRSTIGKTVGTVAIIDFDLFVHLLIESDELSHRGPQPK